MRADMVIELEGQRHIILNQNIIILATDNAIIQVDMRTERCQRLSKYN